jgi:hypothetical protein
MFGAIVLITLTLIRILLPLALLLIIGTLIERRARLAARA